MTVGYNLYTDAKRRDLYLECLKANERVALANERGYLATSSCYLAR